MGVLKNTKEYTSRRKRLRNNPTPQEVLLWNKVKHSALGFKFRRQHSFGNYIVDFYCSKLKLAIEIDGSQHYEQSAVNYDASRTKYLEELGVKVLRFTNTEINTNIDAVLHMIKDGLDHP